MYGVQSRKIYHAGQMCMQSDYGLPEYHEMIYCQFDQQIQRSLFIATPLLAIAAGASVFFKLSEKIFKEDKNMQLAANISVFVPALV